MTVTFANEKLRLQIATDIEARTLEHQAAVAMIRRAGEHRLLRDVGINATRPLTMLAHGDSWFDYPLHGNSVLPLGNTDIITQLKTMGTTKPLILNISHHGDATTDELSLPKQQRLRDALSDPANWFQEGKPDAILFSGGGNDIAADKFCICLDYKDSTPNGLDQGRFKLALGAVEASYLDLFLFRDRYAAGVPIFAHVYDFPVPDGRHPPCLGPWLKPALDNGGWTLDDGRAIIKDALLKFNQLLVRLAADPGNNLTVVQTQNTLDDSDWANELHPYPEGFKSMAGKFFDALNYRFGPI